jgi:putative membrane protein
MNAADQRMLKTFAINNMAEIEAGRMAQSKTQSEQVRTFAQRMIDDHTKALDDVRQLAQTKGVALPTDLDAANKRKAARLAALSGEAFDRAYMAQAGVADHKKNHSLLQQAQSRAKDPDLQALAARTLPVVDQHLNSAQDLHKHTARGSSKTQGRTGSSGCKQE